MIITDVIIDYINQSNKPNRITKMFVDLDENNMTGAYIINSLPDNIRNDIKILTNVELRNTESIQYYNIMIKNVYKIIIKVN